VAPPSRGATVRLPIATPIVGEIEKTSLQSPNGMQNMLVVVVVCNYISNVILSNESCLRM